MFTHRTQAARAKANWGRRANRVDDRPIGQKMCTVKGHKAITLLVTSRVIDVYHKMVISSDFAELCSQTRQGSGVGRRPEIMERMVHNTLCFCLQSAQQLTKW